MYTYICTSYITSSILLKRGVDSCVFLFFEEPPLPPPPETWCSCNVLQALVNGDRAVCTRARVTPLTARCACFDDAVHNAAPCACFDDGGLDFCCVPLFLQAAAMLTSPLSAEAGPSGGAAADGSGNTPSVSKTFRLVRYC